MTTEARVVITNPTGLHARPAVKFSQLAAGFDADVQVRLDGSDQWVPARSTARVMKLKATPESVIFVRADGEQADEAVAALVAFIHRDFDEGPGATAHAEPPPAAGPDDRDDEPLPSLPRGRTLSATVASRGLAVGAVHVLPEWGSVSRVAGDTAHELAALEAAVRAAVAQLEALAAGEGTLANDLILFQVSLLQDQAFLDPVLERVRAGQPADRAWAEHLEGEIADYSTAETAYLRDRAADLRDLGDRVAMCLGGGGRTDEFPDGAIVVAEELTPSRFLQIDWSRAVGVATFGGSSASHTAMLARSRGVPMLVDLSCEPRDLPSGGEAVLDAERGCIVLAPSPELLEQYAKRIRERRAREREALLFAARPARTRDGVALKVLVNIDDPSLLPLANPEHCDGIGLTRTEFLFHGSARLPDEEAQYRYYRQLVDWAGEKPVTIRTLDAGGDKPVPGVTLDGESNPFLGVRGVRLSLARPDVLRVQLRALARAAVHGDLKVMVPMVSLPSELDEVRRLLREEVAALRAGGVEVREPALGMMVEVPAAALAVESFDADFYSIGSNDLVQYLFAAARDSRSVAPLLDPLHPAVLELIARVAGHGSDVGKEVSICGEMAAQPACLESLIGAGIRVLSVPPAALALTKAALSKLG